MHRMFPLAFLILALSAAASAQEVTVAQATRQLSDADGWIRIEGLIAAQRLKSVELIPLVIPLLADEYEPVREKASETLQALGVRESDYSGFVVKSARRGMTREGVAAALTNYDASVRQKGAELVGLLGLKELAPGVEGLLKDGDFWVRASAAEALGRLGAREHAASLAALLKDASPLVQDKAAAALRVMGEASYLSNYVAPRGAAAAGPGEQYWLDTVAAQERILETLAANAGRTIPIDATSELGRFIHDFALAPGEAREFKVTDELLERAVAVHRFMTRDYYYPGSVVMVRPGGPRDGIRFAYVEEVEGERVRVRLESWNPPVFDMTRAELFELNAPRYSPPGKPVTFVDIRIDPANDPQIQPLLKQTRATVDGLMPQFVDALVKNDMVRATELQMEAVRSIYDSRVGSMSWNIYDPPVPAGQAWAEGRGACHTRAGVMFSAMQAELLPRMGVMPQLQIRNWTLNGDNLGHSWAGYRVATGAWLYSAATWAAGNAAAGFAADPRHINGDLIQHAGTYGFNMILGVKMALHKANLRGYTNRFVEKLVRAKAQGSTPSAATAEVLKKWKYEGSEAQLAQAVAGQANRLSTAAKSRTRTEATGVAKFGAAYFLKEGLRAIETGDPGKLNEAAKAMATVEWWKSFGVFVGGSKVGETALKIRGTDRKLASLRGGRMILQSVPLAVGMTAAEALTGEVKAERVALGTGSFLGAGMAINGVGDRVVRVALKGGSLPRVAGGLYELGKLTMTLYAGEKAIEAGERVEWPKVAASVASPSLGFYRR